MSTITQDVSRRNNRSAAGDEEMLLIAEWPLSRGETARVCLRNFKGSWLIDVRKWYETGGGDLKAGPKGIALSVKNLRRMSVALNDALLAAKERGLIDADGH